MSKPTVAVSLLMQTVAMDVDMPRIL